MITGNTKQTEACLWVCNECNFPNFTGSVSDIDIELELYSCVNCGCFEFHKEIEENIIKTC